MSQPSSGYPSLHSANPPPGPYSPNFPQGYFSPQGNAPSQVNPPQEKSPSHGYPLQEKSPSQGYPPQENSSSQGYPLQEKPPSQGYPPQGQAPSQEYPPQGQVPSYGYPTTAGYTPQGYPQENFPSQLSGPQDPLLTPNYGFAPQQKGYILPSHQPMPIVQQPGSMGPGPQSGGGWMNMPQGLANCPPGLEYLSMIDQLLVHQKVELLEAFTGFETNNKFTIKNSIGQKVYYAAEDNDCCTRNCCGSSRPFEMKILDNFGNQVMNLHRPLACDSCWFPCCLQSIEVSSPPGTIIGFVEQEWSLCKPLFVIKNAAGDVVLRIRGPICRLGICGDIDFKVLSLDGETKVGKISKQWSGMARELFTDSDYFGITFPMDLDVRIKAVLLGALFLIDVMYFEEAPNRGANYCGRFCEALCETITK